MPQGRKEADRPGRRQVENRRPQGGAGCRVSAERNQSRRPAEAVRRAELQSGFLTEKKKKEKEIMKRKKIVALALVATLGVMPVMAGCGSSSDDTSEETSAAAEEETEETEETEEEETEEETSGSVPTGDISVISREDGSGTRGAFVELTGVEEDDVDNTTSSAEITNSTAVMMTTVAGNTNAIGYISLGSLDDTVTAVTIDGVEATTDNVKDGSYSISRPFNIVYFEDTLSDVGTDFVSYILSADGQAVIEENGYVMIDDAAEAYEASGLSGELSIGGSSSVTPVMEKLAEAYEELNPDVEIQVQESDSTTGVTSANEGVVDIGMASRELKDEEVDYGLTQTTIAMDGIAVIVNNENGIGNLTMDQVKDIYTGNITTWDELAE